MLGGGLTYALGINSLDITLHIEAKGVEKDQMATALCYSGYTTPVAEPQNLSGTLKLNFSSDATALGFSFRGLKQWIDVNLDQKGEAKVAYGKGWKRRSL